MTEYVFRDAQGYGCADDATMEDGITSAREYYAQENADHYGTLHERIVRCRDCKHYKHIEPDGFCAWAERKQSPDCFCAWAERKEGGE